MIWQFSKFKRSSQPGPFARNWDISVSRTLPSGH